MQLPGPPNALVVVLLLLVLLLLPPSNSCGHSCSGRAGGSRQRGVVLGS